MPNQFYIFAYMIITIFGIFPNVFVCATFLTFRKLLKKPKNVFICSLAFVDFLQSSLACPLALDASIAGHWTTGTRGCQFYALICSWLGLASIMHHGAMAAERAFMLSKTSLTPIPLKVVIAILVSSYLLPLIVSLLPLLGWSTYDFEGSGYHCAPMFTSTDLADLSFTIFVLTSFLMAGILVVVISGIKTYLAVRRIHLNARETWGRDSVITQHSHESEVKTAKIVGVVTTAFFLAWFPYVVVVVFVLFNNSTPRTATEVPALFAKTSLIYNPLIYFFLYKRFRRRAFYLVKFVRLKMVGKEPTRLVFNSETPSLVLACSTPKELRESHCR